MSNQEPKLRTKALTISEKVSITQNMIGCIFKPKVEALRKVAGEWVRVTVKNECSQAATQYSNLLPTLKKQKHIEPRFLNDKLIGGVRGVVADGCGLLNATGWALLPDEEVREEFVATFGKINGEKKGIEGLWRYWFDKAVMPTVSITDLNIPYGAIYLFITPLNSNHYHDSNTVTFSTEDAAYKKVVENFNQQQAAICKDLVDTAYQIYELLHVCKTPQKVYEAMPEALEFLPTASTSVGQLIPAKDAGEINNRLKAAKSNAA